MINNNIRWGEKIEEKLESNLDVKEISLIWDMECGTGPGKLLIIIIINESKSN